MSFSKDFIWGAASAAYQVEGAYNEDGKGMGIWDALSDGHVKHGDNGNVACDHYHRYKEDVALMKEMGLKAYRFSVSWPRIIPEEGVVNPKGIEFYQNLVQELLDAGIEPMCTIFHWNLPMWIYEKGGWYCEEISDYFAEYTKVVVEALSDKVSYWMTVNEPACFIGAGYIAGAHAPFESLIKGLDMSKPEARGQIAQKMAVLTKNTLLSHGKAAQTIRKYAVKTPQIGMALNGSIYTPWENTETGVAEAKAQTFTENPMVFNLGWWADPMILGTMPPALAPFVNAEELEMIRQPLDFFGYNCYNSNNYSEDWGSNEHVYEGQPRTAMDWPITPDVLYWAAKFIYERYQLPVLITENGMANLDFVMSDGKVHDPQRIDFLQKYIGGLEKVAEEGVPLVGYMYWSILDNFEWAEGYDKRFGLVHVDYQTQKRTRKDSSYWYADVIKRNSVE